MADTQQGSDAKATIARVDPDNPKSAPVRDFGNYDDAVAQAKALGVKPGDIVAIGVAYHIPDDSE